MRKFRSIVESIKSPSPNDLWLDGGSLKYFGPKGWTSLTSQESEGVEDIISTDRIADNAITEDKIADEAITGDKIANDTIDFTKIRQADIDNDEFLSPYSKIIQPLGCKLSRLNECVEHAIAAELGKDYYNIVFTGDSDDYIRGVLIPAGVTDTTDYSSSGLIVTRNTMSLDNKGNFKHAPDNNTHIYLYEYDGDSGNDSLTEIYNSSTNNISNNSTIPLTGSINLTKETVLSLGVKYAKVSNNTVNFYIIADSEGKLPSSETRVNVNSEITSLVGAEGANVGDIFVIGKLDLKPVYKIIPLNDAKAENSTYKGTQGIVTPWDKTQINKVPNLESTINAAKNNMPTYTESNMNNALKTGFYPWCTLGRPSGSTGAYTLVTIASTTTDSAGYTTIEQTAYGRQDDELGKIFKRIIFKPNSGDTEFGEWQEITGSSGSSDGPIKTFSTSADIGILQSDHIQDARYYMSLLHLPDDLQGGGIVSIRGVIPCVLRYNSPNNVHYFPLEIFDYVLDYAEGASNIVNGSDNVIAIRFNTTRFESYYNEGVENAALDYESTKTKAYIEISYIPNYEQAIANL